MMKRVAMAPQLYEYHVPGDYLGGDGGMDSDYDDVIAPSEFYGMDQKVGDAAEAEARRRLVVEEELLLLELRLLRRSCGVV